MLSGCSDPYAANALAGLIPVVCGPESTTAAGAGRRRLGWVSGCSGGFGELVQVLVQCAQGADGVRAILVFRSPAAGDAQQLKVTVLLPGTHAMNVCGPVPACARRSGCGRHGRFGRSGNRGRGSVGDGLELWPLHGHLLGSGLLGFGRDRGGLLHQHHGQVGDGQQYHGRHGRDDCRDEDRDVPLAALHRQDGVDGVRAGRDHGSEDQESPGVGEGPALMAGKGNDRDSCGDDQPVDDDGPDPAQGGVDACADGQVGEGGEGQDEGADGDDDGRRQAGGNMGRDKGVAVLRAVTAELKVVTPFGGRWLRICVRKSAARSPAVQATG